MNQQSALELIIPEDKLPQYKTLAANAGSALRKRSAGSWSDSTLAYVLVHYLYGLTRTTLEDHLPEIHIRLLSELASIEVATEVVESAIRTDPGTMPPHIVAIGQVVESYGLRDSALLQMPVEATELEILEPSATQDLPR